MCTGSHLVGFGPDWPGIRVHGAATVRPRHSRRSSRAVRRRHPDVDIVVLPPGAHGAARPAARADVDAGREQARPASPPLVARASGPTATDRRRRPRSRLGYGPQPGTVVAKARLSRAPDGRRVVRRAATRVAAARTAGGGRVGPTGRGPAHRRARRPPGPGVVRRGDRRACSSTVASDPMSGRRRHVRGAGEAVMEVVPLTVGPRPRGRGTSSTSTSAAAAEQIGGAAPAGSPTRSRARPPGSPPPGSGTPPALADQAEAQADGLRTAHRRLPPAPTGPSATTLLALQAYLAEIR